MQFLESILQALASLKANKLRSILTLIGVIIGVMTVIAVTSIVAGMNRYVANELSELGPTTFFIDKWGVVTSEDQWFKVMKRKDITLADMEAVQEYCTNCEKVGAMAQSYGRVKYGNQHISDVEIHGATPNIEEITSVVTDYGYYPTDYDNDHRTQVALIGWAIADKLFPGIDPIGKRITIAGHSFRVVGVAEKRGSFLGQNQDNFVAVPLNTYQKLFQKKRFDWFAIFVKARDYPTIEKAKDECRLILRARRHVPYKEEDDFSFQSSESLMQVFRSFTAGAFIVMIGISSIALLVGGIVIMNIMFVSVKERTKEIGIRKALGARRRNILWQFVVEATTISLVGGILGVIFGGIIGKLVDMLTPLPAAIEVWAVFAGIMVAGFVGLFFGIYPAMKAARLDPVEALRYE
ncbi:MAG: hypothetical protein A2Z27_01145 [candidate division Zixibacteria bacterium RBG_16_50_21]|nr:MAG: hypothetical protein A2Z27_01145 [candidate division Zixibacteria bacterium RBG_16_50_21]